MALSAAEKKKRAKLAQAKYRAKKKAERDGGAAAPVEAKSKGGTSWLKSFTGKLEESVGGEELPTEGKGEPFADLPKVQLPGPSANAEGEGGSGQSEGGGTSETNPSPSTDAASASTEKTSSSDSKPSIDIDNKELAKMAGEMVRGATLALGAFAAERGFFAFGDDMAKIAGTAASVIVRAQATRLEIDSEEGAAYIIMGITGTNAVQAGRAYLDEKRKKEEMRANEQRAAAAIRTQHQAVNGTAPPGEPRGEPAPLRRVDASSPVV
jgi:hypothetical protein